MKTEEITKDKDAKHFLITNQKEIIARFFWGKSEEVDIKKADAKKMAEDFVKSYKKK